MVIASLLGVAAFAGNRVASAQVWLDDRKNMEGPGVRTGDFEIHPGIELQGGYDSNYFMRTDNSGFVNSGVVGAPAMLVTPSIAISTLGAEREGDQHAPDREPLPVSFRASASGTYQEFFGQLSPEQRNGSVQALANLGILPGRPWGAMLDVSYNRFIQPSPLTFSNPDLSFTRDTLAGRAEIIARPGSGTLDWHLGANVDGTLFEDTGGLGYNNVGVGAYTLGHWKFSPKTALVYDASLGFATYTAPTSGDGEITPLHSSDPLRTHIGVNGLLTPRLSATALVGYGGSFFLPGNPAGTPQTSANEVQQYDSVIAQAELKIFLTEPPGEKGVSLSQSFVSFGYTRDFQQSYISDFYGLDRGYLKFAYYFAGRAMISLEGGGAAIEYPELFLPTATHTSFTDARIDGTLFAEYRFTNWFGLNANVKYTNNISNAVLNIAPAAGATGAENYSMQFQRFQAYLGVRAFL